MAAHTGDIAGKSRFFRCATCGTGVYVRAGERIPACPDGHVEFKSRMQRAGTRPDDHTRSGRRAAG